MEAIKLKLSKINKKFWLHAIDKTAIEISNNEFSKKERKKIIKHIETSIKNSDITESVNWISALLLIDEDESIDIIKSKRLLKFSLIKTQQNTIEKIIKHISSNASELKLNTRSTSFLLSKINLFSLQRSAIKTNEKLCRITKRASSGLLRDILSRADFLAYLRKNNIGPDIPDHSFEDKLEAASYLTHMFFEENPSILSSLDYSSETEHKKNNINTLLQDAILIKEVEKTDTLIDCLNYGCVKKKNKFIISAETDLFQRSLKYGYISSEIQQKNLALNILTSHKKKSKFLLELSSELEKLNEIFVEYKEKPIERYTFKLPLIDPIIKVLTSKSLFIEEIIELESNLKEISGLKNVKNLSITENLTVFDIITIKRLFTLVGHIFYDHLYLIDKPNHNHERLLYNSWLPTFTHNSLINILEQIVSKEAAKSFLELFSWHPKKKSILDLQYTPLIKTRDEYYLNFNILITASTIRNLYYQNKIRPISSINEDTTSLKLFETLKLNFNNIRYEIDFKHGDFHGDFDVIANIEDTIYVFECKNILIPTGPHELRTTFDNLKKGFDQLNKCRSALKNSNFIRYINQKENLNIKEGSKIVTCLVFSNRMFNGYSDGTNQVRSLYELCEFLKTGNITVQNKTVKLWKYPVISNSDIFNYIENSMFHSVVLNALHPLEITNTFNNKELVMKTYELRFKDIKSTMFDRINTT